MSGRILKLLLASVFQIMILCSFYTSALNGSTKLEGKIVGGEFAKISKFPHAVYLVMTCGKINMICGSSVINQFILLTAAHCLECKLNFKITAKAGHENLKEVSVVRKVSKYKIHSKYSDTALTNDIGLILLSKSLPLGNNIKRVIIKTRFPKNTVAYVAGWGITDDETRCRTLLLKMVEVPLRPQKGCSLIGKMLPGMMCAGSTHSTTDRPTKGDSGSALITTSHQQLGLVSFRTEHHSSLVVYTNVSYYYSWIQKTAKQLYCARKIKKY